METRPTPDRLKESLFSILQPRLPGCRFLDICAGTGTVGIEALSRGASHVTFVERSQSAVVLLKQNLRICGIRSGFEIIHQDALLALPHLADEGQKFDIIFFDPPYRSMLYPPVMKILFERSLLEPDGVLIVMHHNKLKLEERYDILQLTRRLKQGENVLSFYTPQGGKSSARLQP